MVWKLRIDLLVAASLLASCATRSTYRLMLGPSEARPKYNFSVRRNITYSGQGEDAVQLDLFKPDRHGLRPGVVLIHGGGWYDGKRTDMENIARRLASRGFVVANISYRLAPKFRYPAAVVDTCAAISWLKKSASNYQVDPQKIATFGYSAGGHLALLTAYAPNQAKFRPPGTTTADCSVNAAVGGAAPTDLSRFDENTSMTRFFGVDPIAGKEPYAEASPWRYVNKDSPPTFLYHGRSDWTVPVEQSHALTAKLKELSVPYHYLELRFGHFYNFFQDRPPVQDAIQFLRAVFAEPQEA